MNYRKFILQIDLFGYLYSLYNGLSYISFAFFLYFFTSSTYFLNICNIRNTWIHIFASQAPIRWLLSLCEIKRIGHLASEGGGLQSLAILSYLLACHSVVQKKEDLQEEVRCVTVWYRVFLKGIRVRDRVKLCNTMIPLLELRSW